MVISTKGRYALRLMLDIAMQEGTSPVPLHDIAERQGVSLAFAPEALALLGRHAWPGNVRELQNVIARAAAVAAATPAGPPPQTMTSAQSSTGRERLGSTNPA